MVNPIKSVQRLIPEKLYDGVATRETHYEIINRYMERNPFASKGVVPGQWHEIRREEYFYFLGVLPPIGHTGGSFAIVEFSHHNITDSYHKIGERYFCMTVAYQGPDTVTQARAAIIDAISVE